MRHTFWLTSLPRRALLLTMQYGTSHLTLTSHIKHHASRIAHYTSRIARQTPRATHNRNSLAAKGRQPYDELDGVNVVGDDHLTGVSREVRKREAKCARAGQEEGSMAAR